MSNLVLYKAKRKDNGELVESVSINCQTDVNGKEHIYMGLPVASEQHPNMVTIEWKEVDSATLSKSTGVNDKKGKPIWQYNECRVVKKDAPHTTARGYIGFVDGGYVFIEYIYRTGLLLHELDRKGFEIEVVVDWYDESLARQRIDPVDGFISV